MLDTKTIISLVLTVLVAVYTFDTYFCRKKNLNEPKYIRPSIPLIGHAVGFARHGRDYYSRAGKGQPEIFTLPILGFRIYVANSRHLLPVIQKQSKTLSFKPFSKVASERFCRASPHFLSLHDEPHAYLNDSFRATRNALSPGKGLDHQNTGTGKSIENFILQLEQDASDRGIQNLPFYTWIKHVITLAATDGVYGARNPFKTPNVEECFWTWMKGGAKMAFGFPSVFLRAELRALSVLKGAFEEYILKDHDDAADIVRARNTACYNNNISVSDTAGNLVGLNIALLGNTVPTAFWAVYDIISRPEVLGAIRNELQLNVVKRSESTGRSAFEFDVVALRTRCPLLLSSYQETQRFRTVHASIRKVVADTTLESPNPGKKYFLAKGNYLQMPSTAIHYDDTVWGNDARTFDPYRFVKDNMTIPRDQLSESYAFMAWGIAPHVCPARQFASTEIMLLTAMLVLRFELEDPEAQWTAPKLDTSDLSTVLPPKKEVHLNVKKRSGWQGTWNLKMGDSGLKIPLASG